MKRLLLPALAVAALFAGSSAFAQTATLDQAKELVKKGRAYLRDNGCEKAFKEINEGSMFKNASYKELYLYVYDKNLVNLAHGGNPRLVGKDLKEMRDTKGRFLNQELLKAAMNGGGAVEFDFLNPGTGNVDPKIGWAEMETKTTCGPVMIGSGVYRPKK